MGAKNDQSRKEQCLVLMVEDPCIEYYQESLLQGKSIAEKLEIQNAVIETWENAKLRKQSQKQKKERI